MGARGQRQGQGATSPISGAARVPELLVDEVFPCHIPLVEADPLHLLPKAIDEPGQRVGHETVNPLRGPAGAFQLPVIVRAGLVVVVAEQVADGLWQARLQQDRELKEPSRAAIAVAEGMYPHEVHMGEDGLQDGERSGIDARRGQVVQDIAEPLQQEPGIPPFGAAIPAHGHVHGSHLAWRHMVFHLQAREHLRVHSFERRHRHRNGALREQLVNDPVVRCHNVVDFLFEVRPRGWQVQGARNGRKRLFLRQRVAFNGGRGQGTLRQIDLVDLFGHAWCQGCHGDMVAIGYHFTQRQPIRMAQTAQVELEREPRMCPLVWPSVCHGFVTLFVQ